MSYVTRYRREQFHQELPGRRRAMSSADVLVADPVWQPLTVVTHEESQFPEVVPS